MEFYSNESYLLLVKTSSLLLKKSTGYGIAIGFSISAEDDDFVVGLFLGFLETEYLVQFH